MTEQEPPAPRLTEAQDSALRSLCERYRAPYSPDHYWPQFDLPDGYVAGWVGGEPNKHLYVGCSAEGEISS